ncbi:MAG: S46 family peptidase [Rikenellaceae bacterium]
MMKKFLLSTLALFISFSAIADEGMWLPSLLKGQTINFMRKAGLKLSAEDLYSVNKASLNDAIVLFGGGCTGEMISPEGLLLTNHHCGYGQIQSHSSVQNDYLTNGFVAMSRGEELPNPGLKVSFMREMRDVTDLVNAGKSYKEIAEEATEDTHLKASVESMYYGNMHYLFLYEEFSDVRLVFAPPSAIGKFGGDTDNWMWPRHTGDFSMFRVYAAPDGTPAEYSTENVPYQPKKFLEISASGVKEGDFTFVYGFPGSTQQYLHSDAVEYIVEKGNPEKIAMRDIRLKHMNAAADTSAELRIKYAAKNASVSNSWKKWQGEMLGLIRLNTVENKLKEQASFEKWAVGTEYEGITDEFHRVYSELNELEFAIDMYVEGAFGSEMLRYLLNPAEKRDSVAFYKNYDASIDNAITKELFARLTQVLPAEKLPEGFSSSSVPTEQLAGEFITLLRNPRYNELNKELDSLYNIYMRGLMAKSPAKRFFPDANMTLRITYGHVQGYTPNDGTYFTPISTLKGVMEKDNPNIYDYDVPQRLRDLAPQNMKLPVAFLATNHTSGGNSGSPVLDAHGRLIGLNFDRVWQGTMSDIDFDSAMCRNISLDMRYVLFLVGEYAEAKHLIDEMVIK